MELFIELLNNGTVVSVLISGIIIICFNFTLVYKLNKYSNVP